MTRLAEADFQRMLGNAGRGGRLGDQRAEAVHTYAEGGLAYLAGKPAVAAEQLEKASRMTGAAALEAGPVGLLRRLAGGTYPAWAVPLAYGDGRREASGILEGELRAHPNNLAARFGQALLAHLDGRHDQSAAIADEVRSQAPPNLSQRLEFFAREERLHQP